MPTKTQALDHLIDVLAGQDIPVKGTTGTVIEQLADMIADGEIVIGGGGGSLKVTFTYDEDADEFAADKTAEDVYEAVSAGSSVVAVLEEDGVLAFAQLVEISEEADSEHSAVFTSWSISVGTMDSFNVLNLTLESDGSVTPASASYDLSNLAGE